MEKEFKFAIRLRFSDEDEAYVARAPELPGCAAHGATPEKALRALRKAAEAWLDVAREAGQPIPVPERSSKEYGGRILLRVPSWLRQSLDEGATEHGVSLNQHIVALLAWSCGAASGPRSGPREVAGGAVERRPFAPERRRRKAPPAALHDRRPRSA